jgi:hypothetical protein
LASYILLHPGYSIYRPYTIQHTSPHFASNEHLKSILVALSFRDRWKQPRTLDARIEELD